MGTYLLKFKKRNKTQYFFPLLFLVGVISSCNGKKSMVLIHNNDYKYWQVIDSSHKTSKTLYYFDKNGKWLVFNYFANNEFRIYKGGDVFLNHEWKLINDSTFNNGIDNRILSLSDTLFEFINSTSGRTKLKAYPDSLVPIAFRKIQ